MKKINDIHFKDFKGIIHMIGIGGIGMSGMAEILNNLGYKIQGSDMAESDNIKRLQDKNIKIFIGHKKENITDADVVVKSSAVKDNNEELRAAIENKIPTIKRAEMLAEITRLKTTIAVSGAHGKTTTTSLVATLFEYSHLNPTVINGGIINSVGTNAYLGSGDYLIAEADESDGTFTKIDTTIAIITNIDREHIEYYGSYENLKNSYLNFLRNIPFYGFGVVCIDNKEVLNLISNINDRKIYTYSIENPKADIFAYNIRQKDSESIFDIKISKNLDYDGIELKNIILPMLGKHNVLNALSAIAIGIRLGFTHDNIINGFSKFAGVRRRFTKVAEINNVEIIDDYAHHPEEIKATIQAAKSYIKPGGRIIAIVQPHRYTRLHDLFSDFTHCFDGVDYLYIADVYSAGEDVIESATSDVLVNSINQSRNVKFAHKLFSETDIADIFLKIAKPKDLLIFLGAGNVTKWAYNLPQEIKNKSAEHV